MMTAATFWKNGSFNEYVLWEISGTCINNKLRGIKTNCIISGDKG